MKGFKMRLVYKYGRVMTVERYGAIQGFYYGGNKISQIEVLETLTSQRNRNIKAYARSGLQTTLIHLKQNKMLLDCSK